MKPRLPCARYHARQTKSVAQQARQVLEKGVYVKVRENREKKVWGSGKWEGSRKKKAAV